MFLSAQCDHLQALVTTLALTCAACADSEGLAAEGRHRLLTGQILRSERPWKQRGVQQRLQKGGILHLFLGNAAGIERVCEGLVSGGQDWCDQGRSWVLGRRFTTCICHAPTLPDALSAEPV